MAYCLFVGIAEVSSKTYSKWPVFSDDGRCSMRYYMLKQHGHGLYLSEVLSYYYIYHITLHMKWEKIGGNGGMEEKNHYVLLRSLLILNKR